MARGVASRRAVLEHEDEGMMGVYQLTGTEGARFAASTIDPTCYSTAFDAALNAPSVASSISSTADSMTH